MNITDDKPGEGLKQPLIPVQNNSSINSQPEDEEHKDLGHSHGQNNNNNNNSNSQQPPQVRFQESLNNRNSQEMPMRRSNSLSRRKTVYQALRERLSNTHDVDWESAQGQRTLTVAEENITYKNNRIQTSRYTALSFLPLNLYEQFSKVSNVYFLIMGLLQMIPQITNSSSIPTVYLPLLFILFVAALKDLLEDLKRHSSDSQENQSISHKAIKIDSQARISSRLSLGGNGKFLDVYSESLLVGTVIKIRQNEMIPADVVLLRSSDAKGSVFVETKNLDGETNLKPKYVQKQVLNELYSTDMSLLTKQVVINYEGPNPLLYSFTGNIQEVKSNGQEGEKITLDEKNLLLRGCILKNTKWAYGVVVYTGHESKIMLNSHTADIKQSAVEAKMSRYILYVCALQFAFCLFAACYDAIWYAVKKDQLPYLYVEDDDIMNKWALSILVSSGIWLMAILNFVPIALLVSLEMIRFLQAMLISNEKLMRSYNGFYPTVQSSNLNEDLGQIQCIFSDKTGTLTCNIMNFKCIYVEGKSYGTLKTESNSSKKSPQDDSADDKSADMKSQVTNVNFQDEKFIELIDNHKFTPTPITDALLHLSLCHSVILSEKDHSLEEQKQMNQMITDKIQGKKRGTNEQKQSADPQQVSIPRKEIIISKSMVSENSESSDGSNNSNKKKSICEARISDKLEVPEFAHKEYEYQAASPDDLALVNFAKYAGYEYFGADGKDVITIGRHKKKYYNKTPQTLGQQMEDSGNYLQYQLYHTLEFNSDRKRMSVILLDKQTRQILVLTKGADSIILGRINEEKYKKTESGKKLIFDLQQTLDEYAKIGLRTLLLAQKTLTEEQFIDWDRRYKSALAAMNNREESVAELQNEIESNLEIVAATAIEDRLQDEVESTISILKEAGILFWILTGDKKETAINIGLSTKVLEKTDTILSIDHSSQEEPLSTQMNQMEKIIQEKKLGEVFCLVVTGEMLTQILESTELSNQLIRIGSKSKSVIACRVSPKQKKDVVTIYRNSPEGKGKRTLAIGDGANDVNMITEAHVGVGIKGLEGMQAARSSDYAIGEFKILKRLLLFHGRECYRRNSTVILFNFYKNAMYLTPLLYFGFSSGFSGSNLYDIYIFQMFNALFTAFPIIAYAVLDKNLSSKVLVKCPHLYKTGMDGSFLNRKELLLWFFQGFFHAALIYVVTMFALDSQIDNLYIADLTQIGQVIFMLAVFIANFKVIVHSNTLYSLSIFIQILCLSLYFILEIFANYFLNYDLYNILTRIFSSPDFYYIFLLVLVTTLLFDYSLVVYKDFMYFQQLALEFKERYQTSPLASTFDSKLKQLINEPRTNLYLIRETLKLDYEEDAQGRAQSDFDASPLTVPLNQDHTDDVDHEMQLDKK